MSENHVIDRFRKRVYWSIHWYQIVSLSDISIVPTKSFDISPHRYICCLYLLTFSIQASGPPIKVSANCHKCYSREQTYKEGAQKSSLSRHTLIERRMLFERLPTEVQLSKQRSMRAIHVLAVCQYHIHHLPVHHCCASKTKTLLLIYNLNFEVHPVYPWILVFFIARNSDLSPSPISKSSHLTFSPLSDGFMKGASLSLWILTASSLLQPPLPVSSILSSFQHPIFLPICADVTGLSHGVCVGQPENSGFDAMTHWHTVLCKQLHKSLAQT